MKVAFPHMGNAYIPLRGLVEYMGVEAVVPAATYCHNYRKTDCHSQLALHIWDRDTFAS